MTLEEYYAAIGGDFNGVRGRLMSDERISKFLEMFFEDDTYQSLLDSYAAGDLKTAFRAAHTLKGTGRDLGLDSIADPAARLADALRPDDAGNPKAPQDAPALLEEVRAAYDNAISAHESLA